MDLIIRRIERIHEVEHGIQDEGIKQICANILYLRVCKRGNDATYFAQKHKIGGPELEMKYTESDNPVRVGSVVKPVETYI